MKEEETSMLPKKIRVGLMLAAGLALAWLPQAHGKGKAPGLVGKEKAEVLVTAAYGPTYPARTFRPTLEVNVSIGAGGANQRTVAIQYNQYAQKYECKLLGDVQGSQIVLQKDQECDLPISTPDFCLLKSERCDARTKNLRCTKEKDDGNLDALYGIVKSGAVERRADGTWGLSAKLRVDGCVLAEGHNNNAPVLVRGAVITVVPR